MERTGASWAVGAAILLAAAGAGAEGTAQLGANQDLVEQTVIKVDVITAGEVINIAVGNDSTTDPAPVRVDVTDPDDNPVTGSPFYVREGDAGFLRTPDEVPAKIFSPLQVTASRTGTYTVTFDNTRNDQGESSWMHVVDPFDITVTPDKATSVVPADPPGGEGRVHSTRWMINAHGFSKQESSNASFYVLCPTRPDTDHTWLLQFNGIAGNQYDVRANDSGMPAPNGSRSVEAYTSDTSCPAGYTPDSDGRCSATPPESKYEIYLKVPRVALGGSKTPTVTDFKFGGATETYRCAVPDSPSTFSFTTDSEGRYRLLADLDGDGQFGNTRREVLRQGPAKPGSNTVNWDGKDGEGQALSLGAYKVRLAVRIGEFHFVGKDIETARPGLRIFSVEIPAPSSTPRATQMYWDDSAINDRSLKIAPQTTLPGGLSSGDFSDAPVCSAPGQPGPNAHCWGDFTTDPTLSPGDERFIDTWVFLEEATVELDLCVGDETELTGLGGGGGCAFTPPARHRVPVVLLLIALLLGIVLRVRRAGADRR